jgi:hypothetical protein
MHHSTVRAGLFGALLALTATGLVTPPAVAFAQTSFSSSSGGLPDAPERPTKRTPKKTAFAFRASEFFFGGATAFDMSTTVTTLNHPTTAHRSDGLIIAHYYGYERGWVGIFGRRDAWTAVTANVLKNVVIDRYSRRFYARGGRWRALGYGLIVAQAAFNLIDATSNVRSNERIDQRVQRATGEKVAFWTP